MNDICLIDFEELAEIILTDNELEKDVSVVGFYEDIVCLIKLLCEDEITYLESVDIHSYEVDGYDKEFVLTLDVNGGIWCEPFCREVDGTETYFSFDSDVAYIFSDVNSKCLKSIFSDKVVEVSFEEDEWDEDEDDDYEWEDGCNCPLCVIEEDDMAFIDELEDGTYEFYFEYADGDISFSTSYSSSDLDEVIEVRDEYFGI